MKCERCHSVGYYDCEQILLKASDDLNLSISVTLCNRCCSDWYEVLESHPSRESVIEWQAQKMALDRATWGFEPLLSKFSDHLRWRDYLVNKFRKVAFDWLGEIPECLEGDS